MNLSETIRSSTSVHNNLLVALDPELADGTDVYGAFMDWIDKNQDGYEYCVTKTVFDTKLTYHYKFT